jgi:hypothetical protein
VIAALFILILAAVVFFMPCKLGERDWGMWE